MESIYAKRPWLKNYPAWVPHDLEIGDATALGDFKRSASANPNAPAVYYFDHAITYDEIERDSEAFAAAVSDLGLKKGDRAILDLQNVPQFLIALYGVWKVGGIVVPLNPMYREKELAYFVKDSDAKIVVTLDEIAASLDLSFLKETSVRRIITTSPLDFLPRSEPLPDMLIEKKRRSVPGTIELLELLEQYRGSEIREPLYPLKMLLI